MATTPWRSFGQVEPQREYLVLLSYLPLKRISGIPPLLLHTIRIMSQLRRSRGLAGYSLRAELGAKRFWTLSAWEEEAALRAFVQSQPHAGTMRVMAPHMDKTAFIRWRLTGSQLPPAWEDALRRWHPD